MLKAKLNLDSYLLALKIIIISAI